MYGFHLSTPLRYDSSGVPVPCSGDLKDLSTPERGDSSLPRHRHAFPVLRLSTPKRYDSIGVVPAQDHGRVVLSTPQRDDSGLILQGDRNSPPSTFNTSKVRFKHVFSGEVHSIGEFPLLTPQRYDSSGHLSPSHHGRVVLSTPQRYDSIHRRRRTEWVVRTGFRRRKVRFSRAIMARIAYTVGHFQRHRGTIHAGGSTTFFSIG